MSRKLADNFSPAWWLRGPHLQTLWSQYFRRLRLPALVEEQVRTSDGDSLYLYHRDVEPSRPRLFLLHGLEGSIRSHYVQGFARGAEERAWNFTLLMFRGCGPEFNTAPRMYHSGETSDLRFALDLLVKRQPGAAIFLAGVSLGGNVLLKYLGENPASVPKLVSAAAGVSVPFDLEKGARHLQRGFAKVYDRHFLKSLKRKALRKLAQHPGLFDRRRAMAASTIEDFDDAVTGPIHGFTGSNDYYTRSSSIHFLTRIGVPTLLLSAEDDPFLPVSVLDRVREVATANPRLRVEFTSHGGHVGFISGSVPFCPVHWAESRVLRFFDGHESSADPIG